MDDVGGLQNMKEGVELLRPRFTTEAIEFGFTRYPVGWLLAESPVLVKRYQPKHLQRSWESTSCR